MKIVVIAEEEAKQELLAQGAQEGVELVWLQQVEPVQGADGYIDLLFDATAERIQKLSAFHPVPVIVNAVNTINGQLPSRFIRINGWKTLLKRPLVEASAIEDKAIAEKIFLSFNKKIEWVPDVPGFISARVISMIINEAWFSLEEKVSSKEEIDTAMKLGTNYPYGPFEWGEKIGVKNVYELLVTLSNTSNRYQPASLLVKQALSS